MPYLHRKSGSCEPRKLPESQPFRTVAARSRSILAVMKRRAIAGRASVQHKMYITDLDHSSARFYSTLIVLAVPAIPARPGVRALKHPAFLQRREAFRACRTHLDFDAPPRTMLGHPRVEVVLMLLHVGKNGLKARKRVRSDVAEQLRGRHAISKSCTGQKEGKQQPQGIDQELPVSVVLTDWLSMPMALGVGSRPACTRVCSRKTLTNFSQVPSSRHWAKES